jgi:DNA-binding LytR/AlgR family response regulator
MEKLKILVIEDNAQDAAEIKAQLLNSGYLVCGIASELKQAREMFDKLQPDLSVIDIFLNGKKDGIVFAQTIANRQGAKHPFIFLTSATDRTTFESARLTEPFNYLLKPFNELELQYAIELAIEKSAKEEDSRFATAEEAASLFINNVFFIKKGNILAKVLVNDIKYIEVDGKYCKLAYGNDKFVVQQSMKQLHDQLPAGQFIRVHRNFIANLNSIQKINLQDHEIVLQDGKSLSFSRRYIDDLMHLFNVLK